MTQEMPTLVESAAAPDWTVDPAQLTFIEYRDRQIWAAPNESGVRPCINRALLSRPFGYQVEERTSHYRDGEDPVYGTWDKAIDLGRNYLVGATVPLGEFLRVHTSSLNEWQRMAYDWCLANVSRLLVLTSTRSRSSLIYHICKRGEYVEFALPHHSHGGEKHWVSRTGKTKVLINVD